jgi:hypothetical protein
MRAIFMTILLLVLAAAPFGTAISADPPAQGDVPVSIVLGVGEARPVGSSAELMGPARSPICDDLKVVNVVSTPEGPAFKGVSPGKTLCSVAAGAVGPRQLFEITVR